MISDTHLSPRDALIVDAVTKYKQLTRPQIERLFFTSNAEASRTGNCNRTLVRLVKWKALARIEERAIGGWRSGSHGWVYTLPGSVAQLRDTHVLNIAELYIRLKESDQLELVDYQPEADISGLSVVPDAEVRVKIGGRPFRFYAEVEYAQKSDERVKAKLKTYERAAREATHFPLVFFLTGNEVRLRAIQRVIDKSPLKEIFRACLYDDAVNYLVGLTK